MAPLEVSTIQIWVIMLFILWRLVNINWHSSTNQKHNTIEKPSYKNKAQLLVHTLTSTTLYKLDICCTFNKHWMISFIAMKWTKSSGPTSTTQKLLQNTVWLHPKIFFGKLLVTLNHFIQIELLLYQHQILNDFYIKKLKTWKDTEKLWMNFLSQLPYMVWRISPGTGASQKSSEI